MQLPGVILDEKRGEIGEILIRQLTEKDNTEPIPPKGAGRCRDYLLCESTRHNFADVGGEAPRTHSG